MTMIRPSYILLLVAIALIFFNPLASLAASYNQESSLVAASIYTSCRFINRLISMAAEAQVEASVVVASVTFMPGKVLQSLLDTLQRFADVMFPLMIVSGILGIIIVPAAKLGAGLAAFGLIIHVALNHVTRITGTLRLQLQRLASSLISIGFLIALILPGAYATGYLFGESITAPAWNRAVAAFQSFSSDVGGIEEQLLDLSVTEEKPVENESTLEPQESAEENGVLSAVVHGISSRANSVVSATQGAFSTVAGGAGTFGKQAWDLIAKIPELSRKTGALVTASFEFIIAYLIKTIVLPIMIAGLAIFVWRRMFATHPMFVDNREAKQVRGATDTDALH